jgi:outer membrane protein assembly factor BamB
LLHCVDRHAGNRRAVWNARAAIVTSPAVTEKHVYVLTNAGVIYGLDRSSLTSIWEARVASGPLLISSPVVAHGHVYVASEHEGLVCAGLPGPSEEPNWPSALGGPGVAGNPHNEPLPERGAVAWKYPGEERGQASETVVTAPIAAHADWLYVPVAGQDFQGLAALNVVTAIDKPPRPTWLYPTPNPVVLSPAVNGEYTAIVDGSFGDPNRSLHVIAIRSSRKAWSNVLSDQNDWSKLLSHQDGSSYWQTPVDDDASGVFAMGTHCVIQDRAESLACVQVWGDWVWRRPFARMEHSPLLHGQMLLAAAIEPASLATLDLPTGELLWQVNLASRPTASPAVAGSVVLLGTQDRLEARSLLDGTPITTWPDDLPGVASELVVRRDWIAYVSQAGELIVVDLDTGSLRRRIPGGTPGITPTTSRDQLLYCGPTALWRVSPSEDTAPTPWIETNGLGEPTTSPVVHKGQLYMGRRGWGLVRFGAAQ